jgi:hypothetical protein
MNPKIESLVDGMLKECSLACSLENMGNTSKIKKDFMDYLQLEIDEEVKFLVEENCRLNESSKIDTKREKLVISITEDNIQFKKIFTMIRNRRRYDHKWNQEEENVYSEYMKNHSFAHFDNEITKNLISAEESYIKYRNIHGTNSTMESSVKVMEQMINECPNLPIAEKISGYALKNFYEEIQRIVKPIHNGTMALKDVIFFLVTEKSKESPDNPKEQFNELCSEINMLKKEKHVLLDTLNLLKERLDLVLNGSNGRNQKF